MKLLLPVSYLLPPIGLLCFAVYFYYLLGKKRFSSMKLLLPDSYLLPPIGLLCFAVYFYYLFITPSQPLDLPQFISTINQSSLSASKLPPTPSQPLDLPGFVSTINQSSLSASKLPLTPSQPLDLRKFVSTTNQSSVEASKLPVYEKLCDYTNGKWVRTKKGPLYNGTNCVQILQKENCLSNGRPDSGFLHWRWKPSECHLPRFNPNIFLQLISNKRMAFIGDSLSRNHLSSLICMLSSVSKPKIVHHRDSHSWLFHSHNAMLTFYWSPFLVEGVQRNFPGPHYNTVYLDRVNMRWATDMDQMDIIVLSFGHWFMVPSIFYEGGKVLGCIKHPVSSCTVNIGFGGPIRRALRTALNSIIERNIGKGNNGVDVIVTTYTPSHFEGDWDKRGTCSKTQPYAVGARKLEGENAQIRMIEMEEVERAKKRAKKLRGFRLEVLDITQLALLRPDGHPGAYMNPFPFANGVPKAVQNDCVHWCLPGPIDTWSEVLMQIMKKMAGLAKE